MWYNADACWKSFREALARTFADHDGNRGRHWGFFVAFCVLIRYDVCKTSKPLTALPVVQRVPL